jgi:5,10-methylenetetrahydromethanopterin reductase
MLEIWRAGASNSNASAEAARAAEAEGWDGQVFMDSQSLCCDPYAAMGVWAAATERLKLAPGVTNPFTRHPAVTATAIATIQAISGGRAVLGMGRGDSALAYLGRAPVTLPAFERALKDLQILLSGGQVVFDGEGHAAAPSLDSLSLGEKPASYGLSWLPEGLPKVPLDVMATGPKVIDLAATVAERVTFSVGAIPERIGWALNLARAARVRCGLADAGVSCGALVIVVCHTNAEAARAYAAGFVAPLARYQVLQSEKAAGPRTALDEEAFASIRKRYDRTRHANADGTNKLVSERISPAFVDRFAIVGSPDHCTARLLELASHGLDRFVIVGPGYYPEADPNGLGLFAAEVLPALRAHS